MAKRHVIDFETAAGGTRPSARDHDNLGGWDKARIKSIGKSVLEARPDAQAEHGKRAIKAVLKMHAQENRLDPAQIPDGLISTLTAATLAELDDAQLAELLRRHRANLKTIKREQERREQERIDTPPNFN